MNKTESIDRIVERTKKVVAPLKLCHHCVHANDKKTWCEENDIPINGPTQYGCHKHTTNEELLRRIAEERYAEYVAEMTRLYMELDIMMYFINGASQTLEKIDLDMETSYKRVMKKYDDEKEAEEYRKKYQAAKKNREPLRKAYLKMKFLAQDMRNVYSKYVEYFFINIFSDREGHYDFKEADKGLHNVGRINAFVRIFVDRTLENAENSGKILDFMLSLKGSGIYDDEHFNRFIIKW